MSIRLSQVDQSKCEKGFIMDKASEIAGWQDLFSRQLLRGYRAPNLDWICELPCAPGTRCVRCHSAPHYRLPSRAQAVRC